MTQDFKLFVFTKYPRPGRVKTRLGAGIGMDRAAAVHRELAERTVTAVLAARLPFAVAYCPHDPASDFAAWLGPDLEYLPQNGADLGERLAECLASALQSHRSAAIIGTDAPGLRPGPLIAAATALTRPGYVLGPATDGGYYLIGAHRDAFDKSVFQNIAWSSSGVFDATCNNIQALGHGCIFLDHLSDVDTEKDLYLMQ